MGMSGWTSSLETLCFRNFVNELKNQHNINEAPMRDQLSELDSAWINVVKALKAIPSKENMLGTSWVECDRGNRNLLENANLSAQISKRQIYDWAKIVQENKLTLKKDDVVQVDNKFYRPSSGSFILKTAHYVQMVLSSVTEARNEFKDNENYTVIMPEINLMINRLTEKYEKLKEQENTIMEIHKGQSVDFCGTQWCRYLCEGEPDLKSRRL